MGVGGDPLVALLFPGQGSQQVGMGRDLAERYPAARETFEAADAALGVPLSRIAWEGPEEELTATHNAQPAILTHSVAVYRVIAEALGAVRYAAGHSLGEFSAYAAAGALDFGDAVRTVRRRGELMYRAGRERPGTMAAILGLDDEAVERACVAATGDGGECVAANYNAPSQVVISGDVAAVERAMVLAREAGAKRAVRLNVSGAFHSPLMEPARAGLADQLARVEMNAPAFAVVSNVSGRPVETVEAAKPLLVEQLTSPVRWTQSMRLLVDAGVQRFLEVGPGAVLAGLLKRVSRDVEARSIGTAEQVSEFLGR